MKTCTVCGTEKSKNDFYVKDKKTGRLSASCKVCHNQKVMEWQNDNRDKVRGYIRKCCKRAYDNNPEKYKEKSRLKRAANPERAREIVNRSYKKIYDNNRPRERARHNMYYSKRREAKPKWLTSIQKAMLQEFYDIASARQMQTGIKYHVDHILPINGENSCGLHVPWNLQILTEAENCAKKNRIGVE